jgi:hypothetical protein
MPEKKNDSNPEMDELLRKYRGKLKNEFNPGESDEKEPTLSSRQYTDFKRENVPEELNFLEKACLLAEKIFRITPDKKTEDEIIENTSICHLNITPAGITSASIFYPAVIATLGVLISFVVFQSLFFVIFFIAIAAISMIIIQKLPELIANNWRMKASNQMVLCIFYVVTYMRHTSNLELALNFAAEHLSAPLSTDIKKVIWNVESGKYSSIKESLDEYFESWKKWNMEFVEAFHLIESSLYETSEDRRLNMLDRSLSLILDETYEKMLHYAHNLKSPITMLHMLGVILPILGLVILPLVVTFMSEVKWYHLALLYDIILPIGVYYLGRNMLSRRPTGYGDVDISAQNPKLKYYENLIIRIGRIEYSITPLFVSAVVFFVCLFIGLSPLMIHALAPNFDFPVGKGLEFLGYRNSLSETAPDAIVGPYGIGATILSMFIPLGLGLAIGIYFYIKSKNLVKIRDNAKKLESEFASALFQLGNRVGDGLPIEIACGKVADIMKGTASGSFFELVSTNIRKLGMGIAQAIFDRRAGAITRFPSNMIESSMKVLVESAKKGPLVVSQSLMNVSDYIKQIHRVDERLKDLLADIISSMKSQISFLTPAIAGIVIGITSMITMIIGKLAIQMKQIQESGGGGDIGVTGLMGMTSDGIPPYFFQIIVGIYLVEITYILIVIANGIENGADSLGERYTIGTDLPKSVILYVVISLIVTVVFNLVASQIMVATLT